MLAAAPFLYALAVRAFEIWVDMHFNSSTVRLLVPGVADAAHTDAQRTKTVGDFIREVKAANVKLYACSMATHEDRRGVALIANATVTPEPHRCFRDYESTNEDPDFLR